MLWINGVCGIVSIEKIDILIKYSVPLTCFCKLDLTSLFSRTVNISGVIKFLVVVEYSI